MSFLRQFHLYTKDNEASNLYLQWSALAALSAIASRKVWIDQGYYRLYPNLYIVLVGSAGSRKTTAMSFAKKVVREMGDIPLAAVCMTKEALTQYMSQHCRTTFTNPETDSLVEYTPMAIFVTELSQFLGTNQAFMIDFLTTIWDEEVFEVRTKNKGNDDIRGPYLTLLGCTTPSHITSYLKADVISGGFSRRAIFVYDNDRSKSNAFPEVTKEMTNAWESAIEIGRQIKQVAGPFKWEKDAANFFRPWYDNLRTKVVPAITDPMLVGYYESKHDQLLKISMLIGLSEDPTCLYMKKDYLEFGLAMLEVVEQKMHLVFRGMGRNELAHVAAKILDIIGCAGGSLRKKEVQTAIFRDADLVESQKCIDFLYNSKQLEKVPKDGVEYCVLREVYDEWKKNQQKKKEEEEGEQNGQS